MICTFRFWFLLGLLIVCISNAFAETQPATQDDPRYRYAAGQSFTSGQLACDAWFASLSGSYKTSTFLDVVQGSNDSQAFICYAKWIGTNSSALQANVARFFQYRCPDNSWTISGTTCTRTECPEGQYRDTSGQCKCDNGAGIGLDGQCCPTSGEGTQLSRCEVSSSAATSCTYGDVNGCTVRCSKITTRTYSGDALVVYPLTALGEHCKYTGGVDPEAAPGYPMTDEQLKVIQEATSSSDAPQTPDSCLKAGLGYMTNGSGVTTCGGGATTKETNTETKTDSGGTTTTEKQITTETRPDGSKVVVEVTTATNADGSKEVTTTETAKTPSGEVVTTQKVEGISPEGVKETETTQEKSTSEKSFCEENPKSLLCSTKSWCENDPKAPGCKKVTLTTPPGTSPVFTLKSEALEQEKANLLARFNEIRGEISAMFNASSGGGGGGALPCWTGPSVLGTSFNICPANYDGQLGSIGGYVMFIAYLMAAFIVLRP